MKMPEEVAPLAAEVVTALTDAQLTIATAESCTGGLIAGALTSISGSSEVIYGGYVTYANEAKISMVGVPYALLRRHGAVSKEVAVAMAEGALAAAGTDLAIAVTGIAGPLGGTEDKPVGLVHFALASEEGITHLERQFDGLGRDGVRQASVIEALWMVLKAVKRHD